MAAAGDQAPRDPVLLGSLLSSAGRTGKMQLQGVMEWGGEQSLQCTGSISREAGRGQGRVYRVRRDMGSGTGGWRQMRMEAEAPFLEVLVLG